MTATKPAWAAQGPTEIVHQDVPRFSVDERDRRWAAVRTLMARDGLDAIVTVGNTGQWDMLNAHTRYLVGIGGNGALASAAFPLEGDVTAIVGPTPGARYWLGCQDWVTDVRQPTGLFTLMTALVERLGELAPSARRGRIGIAGLRDLIRYPEGIVPDGALAMIREALPDAELVNATPVLDEARFVKGAEEVAMLERAVAIAERAVDTIVDEARPGVPERIVYGRAVARMLEEGGEIPTFFSWNAGPPELRLRNHLQPTGRPLQRGDVISVELEASVIGYRGQATQSFVLGSRSPRYPEMLELFKLVLERALAHLAPGTTPGDLLSLVTEMSTDDYQCHLVVHGRGLGEDPPLLVFHRDTGSRGDRMANWTIEPNAVLLVRPYVYHGDPFAGGATDSIGWGDCAVVTDGGAYRLGRRTPGIIEIS